jgi:hypothetical protein
VAQPPKETTPDPSDAFFREVTDDLERDKLNSWWDRYGRTLMTGISVGLIGLAGYLWWDVKKVEQRVAEADKYVEAVRDLDAGNMAKAKPVFDSLAKSGTQGYKILSQLQLAADALKNNKTAEAVAIYDALGKDGSAPEAMQQFASLRSTMVQFDTLKPAEQIARLEPLAQQGGAWFGTAGELLAIAYLNNNQQDKALPLFQILAKIPRDAKGKVIVTDDVPASVRGRAAQMVQMLGGKLDEPPVSETGAPESVAPAQQQG